ALRESRLAAPSAAAPAPTPAAAARPLRGLKGRGTTRHTWPTATGTTPPAASPHRPVRRTPETATTGRQAPSRPVRIGGHRAAQPVQPLAPPSCAPRKTHLP